MSRHLLETFIVLLMMMMVAWFAAPIHGADHFATVTKPRLSRFEHPIIVVLPCRTVAVKQIIPINDKRCPEISSVEINAKGCVGRCSYGCIYPISGFEFTQLPCFACIPAGMKKERVAVLCGAKKIYKRVLIPTGCMCTKVDCTRS